MKKLILGLLSLLLVSASLYAQNDASKELERFQGTWALTSAAGQSLPTGFQSALIITADKYQGMENGVINERGTIKLNLAVKPTAIDLLISEGTHAGKTQLGVVEIAGDTLTLVLAEPGDTARPGLSSDANKLVLARIKPVTKDFEGTWEGAIGALRIIVKLSNGPDGLARGTLVSPDQGGTEVPIASVVIIGTQLKLFAPSIRGTYEGELRDGQLTGTWRQGRGSSPLVLKRTLNY